MIDSLGQIKKILNIKNINGMSLLKSKEMILLTTNNNDLLWNLWVSIQDFQDQVISNSIKKLIVKIFKIKRKVIIPF